MENEGGCSPMRRVEICCLQPDEPAAKKRKTTALVTDQPSEEEKVVVEFNQEANLQIQPMLTSCRLQDAATAWPFASFCDRMLWDLFDPRWEARHGALACAGLREC